MKRYFVDGIDCHWQEHPEGWWVGYEEAEAEIVRLRDDCDYWKGQTLTKDQRIDEAKAEIARLTEERDQKSADFNNELQEMSERFRAVNLVECAKLYDKDVQRELSDAKAEIERLTEERDRLLWKEREDRVIEQLWKDEAVRKLNEGRAEIARLRELLEPFANAVTIHGKRISAELAALKPDTGE